MVIRMALMDLRGRDWPSSKKRAVSERGLEFGRASWCGLRSKFQSRMACVWGGRSPRQVFEPRQTAKKWRVVAGVADETAGPKLAIGIVHPCQVPGQFAFPQTGSLPIEIPLLLSVHLHLGVVDITSR